MNKKLIFVYNANSDPLNRTLDFVHKIISPSTYECNLCAITYNNFGMKKDWRKFIESLDMEVEFLHKDEFLKEYPNEENEKLPAVFLKERKDMDMFIDADEMNSLKKLTNLIDLISQKLDLDGQ